MSDEGNELYFLWLDKGIHLNYFKLEHDVIQFAFQTDHYGDDELGSCLRSRENEGPEVQLQPRQSKKQTNKNQNKKSGKRGAAWRDS